MANEKTRVKTPDGKFGYIPTNQLKTALSRGFSLSEQDSFQEPVKSSIPVKNPNAVGNTMAAEDVLPTAGGIIGGMIGGAATLPTGGGVPFGVTIGSAEGGAIGQVGKNYIRAMRGKSVPETSSESLKESGAEGLKQGAMALGGSVVEGTLQKIFSGMPRVLMNKVLGVSKKRLQAEALGKVEELGTAAAKELSNAGKSSSQILDRVEGELPKIGKSIQNEIHSVYSKTGAETDTGKLFDDAINPIIKKLSPNPDNAETLKYLDTLKTKYIRQYGDNISLPDLEKLKVSLYNDVSDSAWWKAHEQFPDKVKATVALARTARKKINELAPNIAHMNDQYGLYSSMKAFLSGTEAGGGKSLTKLFLEPAYEKVLTGTAVGLPGAGIPVRAVLPAVRPAVQAEIGRRRIGLPINFGNENQ